MSPLLIAHFAQVVAAVGLVGTLILRLLSVGTDARRALRWTWLAWGCWAVQAVASDCMLGLTTADMTEHTFMEAWQGDAMVLVLSFTQFGKVWMVRAKLLAGVFVLLLIGMLIRRYTRRRVPVALDAVNLVLAAALLAAPVWTSHAHESAHNVWLLPADTLHVLAAGAWPGGLPALGILLARARRDPDLFLAAATVTRRFSRMCVLAVGFLAFSGLANAYGLVGALGLLWPTEYGRLLLCKVALFGCMLGLGALNHRRVKQSVVGGTVETMRRMCRDVGLECVLAVGVMLATEALALSAPPQ